MWVLLRSVNIRRHLRTPVCALGAFALECLLCVLDWPRRARGMTESGVRFSVRGTFLEVGVSSSQHHASSRSTKLRACSEPHRSGSSDGIADEQPKLVRHLSSRMNHFWDSQSAAHAVGAPRVALMALKDFFGTDEDVQCRRACALDAQEELEDAMGCSRRESPWTGGAANEGSARGRDRSEASPSRSQAGDARASNPGSLGHPQLCAKPCLHAVAGRCVNGDGCDFCHGPHTKRAKQVDRRDREALRMMPALTAMTLVLDIVREKVLLVDNSLHSALAFDRLAITCGLHPGELTHVRARSEHRMRGALKSMSLRHLLAVLESIAVEARPAGVREAIQMLTADLQRKAATPSTSSACSSGWEL